MIHIHKLRLVGPQRQYGVDFDRHQSNLAIIAGPIHTGKTTILEFIDYLLGDDEHPTHPELAGTVRSAALELSINGERMMIERPLFSAQQVAYVRKGGLDERAVTERKIIDPPGAPDALSGMLLEAIGFGRTKLRVTEGNPNSSAHDLSIRDVMWLSYLPSRRLDNQALLHEGHPQKQYKFRQVIELAFDIHDDRLAQLLDQLKRLREERREYERETAALETFLAEEEVPDSATIDEALADARAARGELDDRLTSLKKQATASTGYAVELRARYSRARDAARASAARVRDREALLERLLPLRSQYAEDERKLVFFDEARRLFDPLSVDQCPACLQELEQEVTLDSGQCSLCRTTVRPTGRVVFAFDRERRALRRRIKDVDAYTVTVQEQIAAAEHERSVHEADLASIARELDDQTAADLSPYLAEREALVRRRTALDAQLTELERAQRWLAALERRRAQVAQTEERISQVSDSLKTLRESRPDRDAVVQSVSDRFAQLLRAWGFPKVDDVSPPYVDTNFIPYVRGRVYREVGSDGALTLIAVAWTLSVFEQAIELGATHPGFLMLDSPQKNLSPGTGGATDEYMDPAIVDRMYSHLLEWCDAHPEAQVIIVDHEPPARARHLEIVRFTRRADSPPYGLIDDQT